jgi:DUF2934 family protein
MAKRPTTRSKTTDPAAPQPPKPKRARSPRAERASAYATETTPTDAAPPQEPSVDDIRRRAYERYLERGGNHGRHFDDWLEAEQELRSKK